MPARRGWVSARYYLGTPPGRQDVGLPLIDGLPEGDSYQKATHNHWRGQCHTASASRFESATPAAVVVEISPLWALDAQQAAEKWPLVRDRWSAVRGPWLLS